MIKAYICESEELESIVSQRLRALFRELEDANWSTADVARNISNVLKAEWLDKLDELQKGQRAISGNFISDGNEG